MAGPLSGIRVIELGQVIAGPFCAQMLGDLGADVVKVEPPGKGDVLRQWGHADVTGDSLWWSVAGRNKRSITVDLRTPSGQQLVRDLVAQADILVENFRPGTLEGWGLGWEELSALRPELIMVRISGFGQTGPYARRAGYASIGEAMGGLRALTGYPDLPPIRVGISIGDSLTGMFGALGAVAALEARRTHRTRPGRRREHLRVGARGDRVAGRGVVRARHRAQAHRPDAARGSRRATSTRPATARSSSPPTRTRCSRRLVDVMGMPELATDPRFVDHRARGRNMHAIDTIIAGWTERFTAADLLDEAARGGRTRGPGLRAEGHARRSALRRARLDRDREGPAARRADDAGGRAAAVRDPGRHPLGGPRARRRHRRRARRTARTHRRRHRALSREDGVLGKEARP